MTYQILKLALSWATNTIETANKQLRETGEAKASQEYLESIAELVKALSNVLKFN